MIFAAASTDMPFAFTKNVLPHTPQVYSIAQEPRKTRQTLRTLRSFSKSKIPVSSAGLFSSAAASETFPHNGMALTDRTAMADCTRKTAKYPFRQPALFASISDMSQGLRETPIP